MYNFMKDEELITALKVGGSTPPALTRKQKGHYLVVFFTFIAFVY